MYRIYHFISLKEMLLFPDVWMQKISLSRTTTTTTTTTMTTTTTTVTIIIEVCGGAAG
jgi:hypothetical protein